MFSLVTLPSYASLTADITEWSDGMFLDLLPFALIAIGLLLGVGFVRFLISSFSNLFH